MHHLMDIFTSTIFLDLILIDFKNIFPQETYKLILSSSFEDENDFQMTSFENLLL